MFCIATVHFTPSYNVTTQTIEVRSVFLKKVFTGWDFRSSSDEYKDGCL